MAVPSLYDHVERGLALLPHYYSDKPLAQGVIETLLSELNPIENAVYQLRTSFTIQNGEGATLDIIGRLFNVLREGREDEPYRKAILTEGILYFADGTSDSIINTANAYTGREDCEVYDHLNGLHYVQIKGGFTTGITAFMDRYAAACGTKLIVKFVTDNVIQSGIASTQELLADDQGSIIQVNTGAGEVRNLMVNSGNAILWDMPMGVDI